MSSFFVQVVFFNDFGSTFEASLNAYGLLCVPFVHASLSSFFHRFPSPPGCRLMRGRRQRRHPLKFGAPLAEGLQAVMGSQPRKSFKKASGGLTLFRRPLPATSPGEHENHRNFGQQKKRSRASKWPPSWTREAPKIVKSVGKRRSRAPSDPFRK